MRSARNKDLELVIDDIADMARYWSLRKFQYIDAAAEQYEVIVRPAIFEAEAPSIEQITTNNMAFTEWLLFERPYRRGLSLLALYVDEPPASLSSAAHERLSQVRDSIYFSRFSILDKDPDTGVCVLSDTRTGKRYDVYDPHVVEVDRWRDGVVALHIACVDGAWLTVGQLRLYDVAPAAATMLDGPGDVHDDDPDNGIDYARVSYFLRLLHDVMGVDGRYTSTLKVRSLEPDA